MVGKKFGNLTVMGFAFESLAGTKYWHCKCICGKKKTEKEHRLLNNEVRSCGYNCRCRKGVTRWKKEDSVYKKRLYRTWCAMKARCENETHAAYKRYGGKGVAVCEEWHKYKNFEAWAYSSGYTDEMTIDRIDVNGNYEPNNCQWLNKSEHAKKTNEEKVTKSKK